MAKYSQSLRERKKERTREAIIREARALFVERGYDATTVADIAERVEIAPSTVLGYFPTKDSIFFAEIDETLDDFGRCFLEWLDEGSALAAARRWYVERYVDRYLKRWSDTGDNWGYHQARLLRETPVLMGALRFRFSELEKTLATGFARDLGDDPNDLRPRIVAAALNASVSTFVMYWSHDAESKRERDEFLALLDYPLAFVEAGFEALSVMRSPQLAGTLPRAE